MVNGQWGAAFLVARGSEWRFMICPICGEYAHFAFAKYNFQIFECCDCAHQFLANGLTEKHVENVYHDRYCTDGGAGCPGCIQEGPILRDRGKWYAEKLTKYLTPGRVLDVGAASGFVLAGFLDKGWQGTGLEPNETMARYGREHLKIPFQTGVFENHVSDEKFELVSMIQVLPHFFDLDSALLAAANATAENGHWLVEIWNRGSWTARLFGSHWHEYSAPGVVRWFAPYDLNLVAARFGFEPVASGMPKRWVQGGHAKSLLDRKFPSQSIKDKFARALFSLIPKKFWLPYPAEDLYWALFRKVRTVEPAEILARRPIWEKTDAAE